MTSQQEAVRDRNNQILKAQKRAIFKKTNGTFPEKNDRNWEIFAQSNKSFGDNPTLINNQHVKKTKSPTNKAQPFSSINWDKVNWLYTNDEIITLKVIGFNRGGVLVEGEHIYGFVPASHLVQLCINATKHERERIFCNYLDQDVALKVIEFDPNKNRIVFSERAALAGAGKRKHLLNKLKEGDIVTGFVTNITDFGVFVDLGGLEGLIHVSELSWGRVHHPSTIFDIGDEVETMVVNVYEDQARVALSCKRLKKNPWDNLADQIDSSKIFNATVTKIVKYGVFARLEIGIEGLIHISTIDFPANCSCIEDFLSKGQTVKVFVISVDSQKRRLGLKLEGN